MTTPEAILYCLMEGPDLTRGLAARVGKSSNAICSTCRCLKRRGLITSTEGVHDLTVAGRSWLASGKQIPCGPGKGNAAISRDGLRQKAWRAMQMMDVFTVDKLLEVVSDGSEGAAENNLHAYCRALYQAGLAIKSRTGGFIIRQNAKGPKAPSFNKSARTVTNRNTGEVISLRREQ